MAEEDMSKMTFICLGFVGLFEWVVMTLIEECGCYLSMGFELYLSCDHGRCQIPVLLNDYTKTGNAHLLIGSERIYVLVYQLSRGAYPQNPLFLVVMASIICLHHKRVHFAIPRCI
jgi:hypothetical protein